MLRSNWTYLVLLVLALVVLFKLSEKSVQQDVNWSENFNPNEKSAFGCYVAKKYAENVTGSISESSDVTAYVKLNKEKSSEPFTYFFVNSDFNPSAQDVVELCKFVSGGNTVFIASNSLGMLSDTLKVYPVDPLTIKLKEDSLETIDQALQDSYGNEVAQLVNPSLKMDSAVSFSRHSYAPVFKIRDSLNVTVLGIGNSDHPNFIRVKMGKGYFLLHSFPQAFGNYYAAQNETGTYIYRAFNYLPLRKVIFDTHYKRFRTENTDSRRFILSEPSLRIGYFIVITGGILLLLFGGKRRQKAVPVLPAVTNTTLEFVEQIGALYYRTGDHNIIVLKKISFFLESLRSRFHIPTNKLDPELALKLSSLSGVPKQQIDQLFSAILHMQKNNCTERDLKNLQHYIWEFNQKSKR